MKTISNLPYVNRDGEPLCLDLHLPDQSSGLLPVILGVPGGGWANCAKEGVPTFLVDHGFAMACINYRVSTRAMAPANILDCKAAVRWLRTHAAQYGLDPKRIGAYGISAGGHLVALLGASNNARELDDNTSAPRSPGSAVTAVCAVCGPTDLTRIGIPDIRNKFPVLYDVTAQYLGGPVGERTELARRVSPLTYVSRQCPPMLLIHGTADNVVPVEETTIFHAALQRAGADSAMILVEGIGHDGMVTQTGDATVAFFRRTLG